VGVLAELMDQDAKAARSVSAAMRGLGRGERFDEVGAEGFVLTMGRVLGLEEHMRQIC